MFDRLLATRPRSRRRASGRGHLQPRSMATMAHPARSIAEEIRRRVPGVGAVKLHKLLYYAQGHHLGSLGVPLFRETISAWDMGPVVGTLWHEEHAGTPSQHEPATLGEAELNTIGYVVSRYGGLSADDLIRLSQSEPPWRDADALRSPGRSVRIDPDRLRKYFANAGGGDETDVPPLDFVQVKELVAAAAQRLARPARPDSRETLEARLAALRG
jgi:uncharacterized phage-associated protein